jgi:hypothetical protein
VQVEKEIFIAQINIVVDDLFNEMESGVGLILPPLVQTQIKSEILAYMNTVTFNTKNYDDIRKQNDNVIDTTKKMVFVFATILGACLFSIYLLRFCVDMKHHLAENLMALGAIAATEYFFLNLVARNYISANPNHVKLYFAQQVQAYAQKKINS